MNVLLAEAAVPYDIVLEMDEINDDFPRTDVGAGRRRQRHREPRRSDDRAAPSTACPCSRSGRPRQVVILKRGRGAGYAGVDNPLFYEEQRRHAPRRRQEDVDGLLSKLRE
jgi:NAD(P) transhydrogenase subunit beta